MDISIIKTAGYGLLAEVLIDGQVLGVMDNFSMIQSELLYNSEPEFSHLSIEGTWEGMFSGNPDQKKMLLRTGDWSYEAYGQIISIKPVIADFGLFTLELGNFTNDEKCVGEWIVEHINRLDLTFSTKVNG